MCSVLQVLGQDVVPDTEIDGTETTAAPLFDLSLTSINCETNFMELEYQDNERLGETTFLEITANEVDDDEEDVDDTVIHSGPLKLDAPSTKGVYELNHLLSTTKYKVCITRKYINNDTSEEETEGPECGVIQTIGVIHTKELLVMLCVLSYFAMSIIGGYCCHSSKKSKLEAAAAEEEAEEEEKKPIAETWNSSSSAGC